ncbi:adenylate/guanylate cyclase domain-containing protein [Granulosicoccaceae sp. 1_MG-2023]|nr:adenylate/guanylate cyclase domain-containing protein [Granulosicoccaceae sp. 1_MG-2023]
MTDTARQSVAIMFADIGGSTRLYEEAGDEAAHRLVAESLQLMEDCIQANRGTLLRTVGDAALASFTCCDEAYEAAVAIQQAHENRRLSVRIGFHFGPVIPDKGDIYGNAVNVAARVASLANLDEITTTEACVGLMSAAMQQRASLLDFIHVKGISEPLAVHRLLWRSEDESVTAIQTAVSLSIRHPSNVRMVLSLNGRDAFVDTETSSLTIGRTADNALCVARDCASRNHATIELQQGKFLLTDQSTNGTYLLKDGQGLSFLRRETVTLDGEGVIGAGWVPEADDPGAIRFRIERL